MYVNGPREQFADYMIASSPQATTSYLAYVQNIA